VEHDWTNDIQELNDFICNRRSSNASILPRLVSLTLESDPLGNLFATRGVTMFLSDSVQNRNSFLRKIFNSCYSQTGHFHPFPFQANPDTCPSFTILSTTYQFESRIYIFVTLYLGLSVLFPFWKTSFFLLTAI
jgi:hypothetical protein